MFFTGSRYLDLGNYTVTARDGTQVKATRLPLPAQARLRGFHRRNEGQRLDLIAYHHLGDPTAFFRLCDANGSLVPDALGSHDLIAIPVKKG